jgi:hypothetical protein
MRLHGHPPFGRLERAGGTFLQASVVKIAEKSIVQVDICHLWTKRTDDVCIEQNGQLS